LRIMSVIAMLLLSGSAAASISKVYTFQANYEFGPFPNSPQVTCSGATNSTTKVSTVSSQIPISHFFGASAGGANWGHKGVFLTMDAPVTTNATVTLTGVQLGSYTQSANIVAITATGLQAPPTTLQYETAGGSVGTDTPCPPSHCVMPDPNVEGARGPSTCGFTTVEWGPYPTPTNGTVASVTSSTSTITLKMPAGSWQVLRLVAMPTAATVSSEGMWQTELTVGGITVSS